MAQTVIQLVQEFCGKKTLPVPGAVVGATDTGVVQIRYLLAEVVRELSEFAWTEQKVEKTFPAVAAQNQGSLLTLIGADFRALVPQTFWNRTLKKPVFGPVSDVDWEALQVFPSSGPDERWKVIGQNLFIYPVPTAGHVMALFYQSSYGVLSAAGATKTAITADDDTLLFPEILTHKSLDYRWKRQKGEAWETDYNEFMNALPKKLSDRGMPAFSLDDGMKPRLTPGIWVPAGNWPV